MTAGNRMFFGGLALAENINAALAQNRANKQLREAERYHCGSIAQLSAALAAIRQMDPSHPLNSQRVRDQIDEQGQRAGTFAGAWQAYGDPVVIHAELTKSHELARLKAVQQIEKAVITHRQAGWFSSESFVLFSTKFDTAEAAQAAKAEALRLAKSASLDESLDPAHIVKTVLETNLKLLEPVPVAAPRGPRPPPRAFRRRKM